MATEEEVDDFLAHYGVLGMKWGVRKDRKGLEGVSSKTAREAKKDANEFAKAKMFYGDGAGTRRKLIKAKVNSKSRDASYKKAFDHYLENQDMAKRASQARGERSRKDTTETVKKTARGIKNLALNTGAPVTLGAVAVYAAWKNPAVRETVVRNGKVAFNAVKDSQYLQWGKAAVVNLLKK